jgi:hypothetical protein
LISDTYEREGSKFKIARWAGINFLPLQEGKPAYPEVGPLPDSLVSPVWDEKLTVVVHGYRRLVEGWDTDKTLAFLDGAHRENLDTKYPFYRHDRVKMPGPDRKKGAPKTPMRIWGTLDVDVSAMALAGDAVLIACGEGSDANGLHTRWNLLLIDRRDGREVSRIELPAEPVSNGLAIDAAGRVYVACRDGRVLCYGR